MPLYMQPWMTRDDWVERSMAAVMPHLSPACAPALRALFEKTPVMVVVKRHRRTKHGDHVMAPDRRCSLISVNASGNPYLFLMTLLHEMAHALVARAGVGYARPHGRTWKAFFRSLLLAHLPLFPENLRDAIARHAAMPLYSTDLDHALAAGLRQYDTTDQRPIVADLPPGARFSLGGRRVFVKGPLMRKYFRCHTDTGQLFRISAAARVHPPFSLTAGGGGVTLRAW